MDKDKLEQLAEKKSWASLGRLSPAYIKGFIEGYNEKKTQTKISKKTSLGLHKHTNYNR